MSDDDLPPRLVADRGRDGHAVRRYLRQPHGASEERAWQRLATAAPPTSLEVKRQAWRPVAWLAAGAVAAVAVMVLWAQRDVGVGPVTTLAERSAPPGPRDVSAPPPAPLADPPLVVGTGLAMLAPGRWTIPGEALLEVDAAGAGQVETRRAGVPRITLDTGRVALEVTHKPRPAPFEVIAGPYRFTVLGTTFAVERSPTAVTLSVKEGRVAVARGARALQTIVAGGRWSGPLAETSAARRIPRRRVAAIAPPPKPSRQESAGTAAVTRCSELPRETPPESRRDCLKRLAAGAGLEAEIALYELARLTRDQLREPAAALAAFQSLRSRFPDGALRAEAALSIVELLARLGRHREALDESAALLGRGHAGERAAELRLLRGNIYREGQGDLERAAAEYGLAASVATRGATADQASFLFAVSVEALGRRAEAAEAYRRYLKRTNPAREREARARLGRLEQATAAAP